MKIEFEALRFAYAKDAQPVFDGFSESLSPGVTLLRGYSGCGKSTLLRLIAGYLVPDAGHVVVPPSGRSPDRAFQTRYLGFVFQSLNLLPDATLRRNLEIAVALAGVPQAEFGQRFERWCARLGLLPYADVRPTQLSGGQQQRAAIARALIHLPTVLCLDEPTSGLDDLNTGVICEVLAEFTQSGRFCVVATHDERLASIAGRVIDFNRFLPMEPHLRI